MAANRIQALEIPPTARSAVDLGPGQQQTRPPAMKFLCLHGRGTSASIFSIQTAALREKVGDKHTFEFANAPFRSSSAQGIDLFFPGPYYAYWLGQDIPAIREAHRWLDDLLERQGPYDAVMGFSQGCSLISTYLIYHLKERPGRPLPFKAAVFICGGYPLNVLTDLGIPVSSRAVKLDDQAKTKLDERTGALSHHVTAAMDGQRSQHGLWDVDDADYAPPEFPTDRKDIFGLDYTWYPGSLVIPIPTLHIYGGKDPRYPSSVQLAYLTDLSKAERYDHGGGHDIPRTTTVSESISAKLDWLDSAVKESLM